MRTESVEDILLRGINDRRANGLMWFKIFFWLGFWGLSWGLIIFTNLPGEVKFALGILHILGHLFIALNIAHDANHYAITSHKTLAALLKRTFDIIGISSWCWRRTHNRSHHVHTSIHGKDLAANGRTIMRFTEGAKRYWFHRFQYLYAPFVYAVVSLNAIFIKDFVDFRGHYLTLDFLECVSFKIFYVSYALIIPMIFMPDHMVMVVFCFLLAHALQGQLLILIQVPHFNAKTFPVEEKDFPKRFDELPFILRTSADMCPESPFWSWMLGGTNTHTVHHVLPYVCHTHYPELTKRLREHCLEQGLEYRSHSSMRESYLSHYLYLKRLGMKTAR